MAHARTVPLLFVTLALVLVLPGLLQASETQEFADEGFTWTVPDGWQFVDVQPGEKSNGYVAKAQTGTQDSFVTLMVRSIPNTDPNFLREHTEEVRAGLAQSFQSTTQSLTTKGSLAGVKGTLIKIKGKDRSDNQVHRRVYGIQAGNRIHQVFMIFVHGSETELGKTADAARRGFKLKSGGSDEPADPELTGGAAPEGDGEAEDEADDGPGGRPKVVGTTITFPSQNLKCSIPEGSPFSWASVTDDEALKEGTILRAEAEVDLEIDEEAAARGRPTHNRAILILSVGPITEGWTPAALVKSPQLQGNVEANLFDNCDYGRMKVVEQLPIGNFTGAALQMVGQKDGKVRYFRLYAAGLKGRRYVWECILSGDGSVDEMFKKPIKDIMAAVEFMDTETWVRGPLAIQGVAPYGQARGFDQGKEKEIRSMGFTAKKPPQMAAVEFQTGGNLRLAWEMRSEDKQNYLYFDVQTWSARSLQGKRDFEEEAIKQREGQWKEFANSPQTIKKGKEPFYKASYSKGRGFGYEFTGYLGDSPFVERGFVVQYKKYYYWIRYQFGGENAEKIFAKTVKTLKKSVKFSR